MTVNPPRFNSTQKPEMWGYHGRVGDLLFRFSMSEAEPFQIQRSFSQRPAVNTDSTPEDFADEFGLTYSMVEFTAGDDRRFAHRRTNRTEGSDQFWRSYGLEINDEGDLQIVNQMGQITASAGAQTHPTRAAFDGTDIYHTNDTVNLTKIESLVTNPPTTSTEVTGLVGTARDVAALGSVVYACDGAEIRDNDGGWAQWSDLDAVRIWATKDRIVASTGTALYDDPDGVGPHTAVVTVPTGQSFVDVVDAGAFVLAASESTVFALTFDGTALSLAAQREFPFETITAIGALQGAVLVHTYQREDDGTYTQRLWFGSVDDGGVLQVEVVREWESATLGAVSACLAEVERDSVYLAIDDGTDTVLWKYNVGFGYLMSDRIVDGLTGQQVTDIIKAEGRFWVFAADGDVWRETTDKRAEGTLITPAADFFSSDPKVWERLTVVGDYPAGAQIVAYVSPDLDSLDAPHDNAEWIRVRTHRSTPDASTGLTIGASRYLTTRLVLKTGAVLRSVALRALPPLSDTEIRLTINASDDVFRPGKRRQNVRGLGEAIWNEIRGMQGRSLDLEIFALDTAWRGSLVQVATPVTQYLPDGSLTKVVNLIFRGEPLTNITSDTNTWGAAQWGVGLWGSNEVT